MGKLWALLAGVLVVGCAIPAGASTPKTALIYGDSLVWESRWKTLQTINASSGWTDVDRSVVGTAPCDWLAELPSDLATYKPTTVTLATAGNTGSTSCMTAPTGSPEYFAQYRSDLDSIFLQVTATDARMVFVEDPPFMDPTRDAAVAQIISIAVDLAGRYHGVSIVTSARSGLSKRGKYVAYKPCLSTETASMGCNAGQIAIRTESGDPNQIGLHLCPGGIPKPLAPCQTYSSGEWRFGKVLGSVAKHPPAPVLA